VHSITKITLRNHSQFFEPQLDELYSNLELQRLLLGANNEDQIDFKSWIARRSCDTYFRHIIINDNELIGYVQFVDFHKNNKTGYLGICLKDKFRNSGFGTQALKLTFTDLKEELGVRKVLLKVRKGNPAIFLYEKLGFERAGELKNEYYDGSRYWNVIIYEKFI
tara:strand:- start:47 stop:541 length:495 start_codon:yes stop_codon:yes gene_type:complete